MKAIMTKYHGPTNSRGSRIKAIDLDGNSVYLSFDPEWNHDTAHREAAKALCRKMRWTGTLAQGSIKGGEVFVFVNSRNTFTA